MGVLRRKSPLFRRKSSRNVSAIEAEVDYVIQRSPFLFLAEQQQDEQDQEQEDVDGIPPLTAPPALLQRKEFQIGNLLGTGSFSKVHEVIGYKLSSNSSKKSLSSSRPLLSPQSSARALFLAASSCSGDLSVLPMEVTSSQDRAEQRRVALSRSTYDDQGNARYAAKFIRKDLSKKNSHAFRSAAADLVVEAKYLAALDHPNILKLRGLAKAGSAGFMDGHEGFFMIVDRLQETLGLRIQQWQQQQQQQQQPHLAVKAEYAYQIADALAYLHERRILFRDLKPNNIGFAAGDKHCVQLFDFGLCRELPESATDYEDDEENFQMSGAGTYCYMAPETFNAKKYNLKADVFSWAFLFHEMIALRRPFEHFTISEHKEFVCEIGQRPSLTEYDIPPSLQALLRQAWEQDPTERLTMQQVCRQLEPIVQTLQTQKCLDNVPSKIPPPYQGWTGSGTLNDNDDGGTAYDDTTLDIMPELVLTQS